MGLRGPTIGLLQKKLIFPNTLACSNSLTYVYSDFAFGLMFMSAQSAFSIYEDPDPEPFVGSLTACNGNLGEFGSDAKASSKTTQAYAFAVGKISPARLPGDLWARVHHRQR